MTAPTIPAEDMAVIEAEAIIAASMGWDES